VGRSGVAEAAPGTTSETEEEMKLHWRRRAIHRTGVAVLIVLGTWLAGACGKDRGTEIAYGCNTGGNVPPAVRAALETAADSLFARLERGDWDAVYESSASAVREQGTREDFLGPLQRALERTGPPRNRTTASVSVVRFGGEFPPTSPVPCGVEGKEEPRKLIVSSYPLQASLVQTADVGSEQFYFSTLWHGEEGKWKLAAFFAKPATFAGKDWEEYASEAAAERLADRMRNSALLYNLAIDLVLPNAWTQPADLPDLRRRQGRLEVSAIPTGKAEAWPAGADTFQVFSITYGAGRERPGLVVRHWASAALSDTAAQRRTAERLRDYMETNFPEYRDAFDLLTLVAVDSTSGQVWFHSYPLEAAP